MEKLMLKLFNSCKDDLSLLKRLKDLLTLAKCYELAGIVRDLEKQKQINTSNYDAESTGEAI